MKKQNWMFLTVCAILSASFTLCGYGEPSAKKLIYFGWSKPDTVEEMPSSDLEEFGKSCPFDGIGIAPMIMLKRGSEIIKFDPARAADMTEVLTREDVAEWITALRRLQETGLQHNFVRSNSSFFSTDWFDDAAWERTLANFAVLTYLAKESGCDGLCLDLEAYPYTKMPFMFFPGRGHTFEETVAQVRKRGREWVQTVTREYPDITLFTFIWTTFRCTTPHQAANPEATSDDRYGLLYAFFNGVYDGAPETMKIVDGQESFSYSASSERDYDRLVSNYYRFGGSWIDKANQDKYRKITSMGLALYLDSYKKNADPAWVHHNPLFPDQTALLAQNIMNTLSYADEYAWVWGERGTFWPDAVFNTKRGKFKYKLWDDIIPHCAEAIRFGKEWAKGSASGGVFRNIIKNGSMDAGDANTVPGPDQEKSGIAGWSLWQSSKSPKGTIIPENGTAHFVNVTDGCLAQTFRNPKAGQKYVFSARCRNESSFAEPTISCFFRDAKGQGLWNIRLYRRFTEKEPDGWSRATILFSIPTEYDISAFSITVGVRGTQDPSGKDKGVYFDDAALYEVEYPWER